MAMVVKNNMSAVSTLNTLNKNSSALQKSLSKVSSGMKINSAQDDASGYAISERMRVQIRSLDQANQNTQNGSSMMKTAEGAVSSTVEILKSLKEKAINAANDTNKDSDRTTIQKEIDQFIDQIDDNALTTFNGKYLVDGSKAQQGKATYTAMTNQSLAEDTVGSTKLTALKNRNNESLEIASTDFITASFVKDGNTYTTKFKVGTDTDLNKVFSQMNKLTDAEGKAVQPFGMPDTNTEKMSLADAQKIMNDMTETNASAGSKLFQLAAGQTVAGATYGSINAEKFAEAFQVLTAKDDSGKSESTTAEILTKLGSNTGYELEAAKSVLEDKIESTYGAGVGSKITVTRDQTGTAATAASVQSTYTVNSTLYDEEGNSSVKSAYTFSYTGQSGTFASNVSTATLTVTAAGDEIDWQDSKDQYVENVMRSIDNVAAIEAQKGSDTAVHASDAVVSGTTIAANNTAGSASIDKVSGTNVSADNLKITGVTEAGVAANALTGTENESADYITAYAFNAALSGNLVNGNTTAIGLKTSGDLLSTADGTKGVTITAKNAGVAGQVSGVTLSITDSEGNVKKAANASLDNFTTSNYAKNRSDANELSFQVGANANQAIAVGLEDMRSEALGLKGSDGSKVSVATQDKANAAIAVFDNAIQKALDQQTTIGSIEARLAYTSENLTVSSENTQAAESTIRDADMAKEMTNYTKNNVLLQAAQSMLAQANQSSSAVLSLLQ